MKLATIVRKIDALELSRAALEQAKRERLINIVLKLAPPGRLTEIHIGQLVVVWSVFDRADCMHGKVVHIIEAGAEPPDLKEHFTVQNRSTALKKIPQPRRPSKYRRYLIERRPGRCFVYSDNPTAHLFYPLGKVQL